MTLHGLRMQSAQIAINIEKDVNDQNRMLDRMVSCMLRWHRAWILPGSVVSSEKKHSVLIVLLLRD